MMYKYILKKSVDNCFICAIRPLLSVGFAITFIGKYECPHTKNVKKPRISANRLSTSMALFCICLLVTDLVLNLARSSLFREFSDEKNAFYNILLPSYINTLNYSVALIIYNKRYLKYTNGLIMLIDRRRLFGIYSILNKKVTQLLQVWSLGCFLFISVISLIFSVTLVMEHKLSLGTILRFSSIFVNNMNSLNFAIYLQTITFIYRLLFTVCLETILSTLEEGRAPRVIDPLDGVKISLQKRLQFLQQFYLLVCYNYKNHVTAFGNALFFAGQFIFSVFSIIQACLSTASVLNVKNIDTSWMTVLGRFHQIFLMISTLVVFWQITHNRFLTEDLLSFLYKYPISKLSEEEANQVEMLITTLTIQKPNLNGADLFTVGIELFVPISGAVVTYILVALQFHASFMSYT